MDEIEARGCRMTPHAHQSSPGQCDASFLNDIPYATPVQLLAMVGWPRE